jgi:hypothetical protein
MGYGLGDIQVHDYQLIDPRFKKLDPDAGIDGAIQDAAKKVHHMCKDIHAHEKEFNDIICSVSIPPSRIRDFSLGILPIILPKLKKPNFSCVHFDPEFGLKKVMLFQPLEYPDWSRHDDTIDYYRIASIRGMELSISPAHHSIRWKGKMYKNWAVGIIMSLWDVGISDFRRLPVVNS